MVKWRWQRGYEGIAACDDKWKDTRKSLDISIIGDIFISVDNYRLPIIVEGTLLEYKIMLTIEIHVPPCCKIQSTSVYDSRSL